MGKALDNDAAGQDGPDTDSKKLERREAVRQLLIERAHPEGLSLSPDWRETLVVTGITFFPRDRELHQLQRRGRRLRHLEPILRSLEGRSPAARALLDRYAASPGTPSSPTKRKIVDELLDRIAIELGDKLKVPRKWVPYPKPEPDPSGAEAFWREEEAKGKSASSGRRWEARKMFNEGQDVATIRRVVGVSEKQVLSYLTPEQRAAAKLRRPLKLCEACGKAFEPKRSDARSCSPACRQALARKAQKPCK